MEALILVGGGKFASVVVSPNLGEGPMVVGRCTDPEIETMGTNDWFGGDGWERLYKMGGGWRGLKMGVRGWMGGDSDIGQ